MLTKQSVAVLFALALAAVGQGCAGTSAERMINQHDHAGLAMHYDQEAKDLREQAKRWEFMAEYYDKHPEPHGKTEPAQHAAHCRAIAQSYKKAADEAEALASEHRAMRPHGVVN